MSKQYTHLAKVYDEFMYDVSYDKWAQYIQNIVKNKKIVEYACGTGNITLPLSKAGYNIIAVDISEEMLDMAQKKLNRQGIKPVFVCEDMIDLKLNKKVEGAICCCDGINYILKEKKLEDFFRNVYENLENNGVFTFDISSEYKVREILGNEFLFDDGDKETLFWQNNLEGNKLTMNISLFVGDGSTYKRFDEKHSFRMWKTQEIIMLLEKSGFKDINAYDFLTFDSPKKKSERIQFTGQRKDI